MQSPFFTRIKSAFFPENLEFRAKLFNVLAIAGFLISTGTALIGIVNSIKIGNVIANGAAALLALALLFYSNRSRRYRLCYIITVGGVFIGLFPYMFFSAGGYHSGMPSFFVFAVIFTLFMLEGKLGIAMVVLELLTYTGICLYAYTNPETVTLIENEKALLTDIIFGFVTVSVTLAFVIFLQLRLYNKRQRELEAAREEALRLSRVKSNFLANMSHEIRTPLNVILGMNEMSLRESASGEMTGYARAIESAGNTLLGMINNVLDMSRIESGKMTLNEEPFRTAGLIGELYAMAHKTAVRKGIDFVVEADEKLPAELSGDKIRIKQIGLNFLSNALKYTEKGRITLGLGNGNPGALPGAEPGAEPFILSVSVADTGTGIREDQKAELFAMFSRLDLPKHRHIEGSGLGLAIAKELTELMGGSIRVESVLEKGSVFTAAIPLKVQNDKPMGKWEQETADITPQGSRGGFTAPGARILAVDDNEENVKVIRSLLGQAGITVDTADSGMKCIAMVTEAETKTPASPYDAILMDYMMPGIDGIETFKLLRNTIKDFDTPVIAIAARAAADAEKLFLDEGFAAYLSKPVLPDHLDEALLRVLPQGRVQIKTAEEQGRTALKPRTLSCEDLIAAMADRGIFLDKGLRYFSLHAAQFRKTLVMFLENYPKRQEEMRLLFDKRDWAALKFRAHSLKSSARAIGAEELSGTAAKLEKYCAAGKAAGRDRLIEATAGLLFPEWEETERGIRLFIDETEAGEDGSAEPGLPEDSGKADLIEKLLNHLRGMNLGAAKKEITALLSVTDQKERLVFTGIREQIQELEYGKAEKLLLEYIKKNPVVFGA